MEYGYIYLVTNLINRLQYVGQKSGEFNSKYFGSGVIIKKVIVKARRENNIENFKLEIIAYADDREETNMLEDYYIKKYDCIYPKGYNLAEGGGGWGNETNPTKNPETIAKIRKALTGRKLTEEHRKNISKAQIGRKLSKEHIEKIKKNHVGMRGRHTSEETKAKLRAANIGKKLSKEHVAKIRAALLGRHHSAEAIAKMSAAKIGKQHSAEHIAKIKIANIGKHHKLKS